VNVSLVTNCCETILGWFGLGTGDEVQEIGEPPVGRDALDKRIKYVYTTTSDEKPIASLATASALRLR
jgi:hypothetical protein